MVSLRGPGLSRRYRNRRFGQCSLHRRGIYISVCICICICICICFCICIYIYTYIYICIWYAPSKNMTTLVPMWLLLLSIIPHILVVHEGLRATYVYRYVCTCVYTRLMSMLGPCYLTRAVLINTVSHKDTTCEATRRLGPVIQTACDSLLPSLHRNPVAQDCAVVSTYMKVVTLGALPTSLLQRLADLCILR